MIARQAFVVAATLLSSCVMTAALFEAPTAAIDAPGTSILVYHRFGPVVMDAMTRGFFFFVDRMKRSCSWHLPSPPLMVSSPQINYTPVFWTGHAAIADPKPVRQPFASNQRLSWLRSTSLVAAAVNARNCDSTSDDHQSFRAASSLAAN